MKFGILGMEFEVWGLELQNLRFGVWSLKFKVLKVPVLRC